MIALSICRFGQRVTVVIGEPIVLDETVKSLESRDAGPEEKGRTITAVIQVLSDKIGCAVGFVNYFLRFPCLACLGLVAGNRAARLVDIH